ncbi:MAG: hypothetical protein ACHQ52_03620 [Candidatus Eisenbacteria bacterium]
MMAHAYTPGLRVTPYAELWRERRLPLKGEVLVTTGTQVEPDTVVARTELPGNVQTLNLASKLSLDPERVPAAVTGTIGQRVAAGEVIAETRGLFGLLPQRVLAPVDGTLESVSAVTGQLVLREKPLPVEVNAYVQGEVAEVMPGEGVVVRTGAALLQGIFGVGGETFGEIALAVSAPDEELGPARITAAHRGKVVVGGARVSHAALMRAREVGVAAVVVGGFDDRDLRELLGRDLGVAVTGSEDLGITLVLTEGFGRIRMAERSWRLLEHHQGRRASVSGATQIRAGVMRPEILIPCEPPGPGAHPETVARGLELGVLVRVIRAPWFGGIGVVVDLPVALQFVDSGALVRVLTVEFSTGERVTVPRANVELIEG